jgi:hypothetical protein
MVLAKSDEPAVLMKKMLQACKPIKESLKAVQWRWRTWS